MKTSEASSITDETSDFLYNPNAGLFRGYNEPTVEEVIEWIIKRIKSRLDG